MIPESLAWGKNPLKGKSTATKRQSGWKRAGKTVHHYLVERIGGFFGPICGRKLVDGTVVTFTKEDVTCERCKRYFK